MEKEKPSIILIDESVLRQMFAGSNKGNAGEVMMKLKEMYDKGIPIKAMTTLSSFLRAIFLLETNTPINNIQKTLSFLEVAPSFSDFKNEVAVRDELLEFAKVMGGKNE